MKWLRIKPSWSDKTRTSQQGRVEPIRKILARPNGETGNRNGRAESRSEEDLIHRTDIEALKKMMEQRSQREDELMTACLEKAVVEDTPMIEKGDGDLFFEQGSSGPSRDPQRQSSYYRETEERHDSLSRRFEMPVFDGNNVES